VLITAAYGAFGFIYKIYSDGSRDWNAATVADKAAST